MTVPFRIAYLGIDHPHGAGWRELLPNLGDEVEVVAIVPGFGGAIASLEERHARVPRFESVESLVKWGQFDGAMVSLTNRETPHVVERLANASKHVLMEKPGAADAAAFTPAARALQQSGVAFQTGYLWRYDSGTERIRDMIADGRFGRLISIEIGQFTSDVRRRDPAHFLFDECASGRGFFNWLGCHWLDLMPFITGRPIESVMARVGNFGATPLAMEDGGTVIIELSGGTLVTFTAGYWLPRWAGELHLAVRGSERWVHWDPSYSGTGGQLRIHGPQPQFYAMEETFTLPADHTPGYGGARGVAVIRDWLMAARGGPACRNTVDSTMETLRVLDAVYSSSLSGCRVPLV